MQTTSTILMVRPAKFAFNTETATNNQFQKATDQAQVNEKAIEEFDRYVELLRRNGIEVIVVQDTAEPHTPDSIFPNNWFSTHATGELVLYPMFAPNRRQERKEAVLDYLRNDYKPKKTIDLTHYEEKGLFLEGTGSMIIDHNKKVVYACRSPRTDETVFNDFCHQMQMQPLLFSSKDSQGQPIYHTNVMLAIGEKMAVICSESITDKQEKESVLSSLKNAGKEIVDISQEQVKEFAGNMLEVQNKRKKTFLIMSARAKKSLTNAQISQIEKYDTILAPDLAIIETNGGGSARCMLAEIFK